MLIFSSELGLKLSFATESQFVLFEPRLTPASNHATQLKFQINLWICEERLKRKQKLLLFFFSAHYRQDGLYPS